MAISNGQEGPQSDLTPRLSVILPVRNGEPYLAGQLESLVTQECTFPWELIVIDNGSTDTSAATVLRFQSRLRALKVLSEPRAGKSNALNTGIAAASGEYLIFVDADDQVSPSYLESMAAKLDEFEMVSARVDTTLLNPPWAQANLLPLDHLAVFLNFRPYIPGALIGIRASACRRIGDFDPDLTSAEDVDFTWRADELGITTGVARDAILNFRRPPDAWGSFRKARSYGRSHIWLYIRYRSAGQPKSNLRLTLANVKRAMGGAVHRKDHWQWKLAWELGMLVGRLEESLRLRTWYV